jgi:hypothetical protein
LAERNTPKNARKFKHLELPSGEVAGSAPRHFRPVHSHYAESIQLPWVGNPSPASNATVS